MGNVGAALRLGAESMIYNPAGLAFINGKMDFAAGATGVISRVSHSYNGLTTKTDNPMGTPLFVYAGIRLTQNLAAGVSLNNPAGNSVNWPEHWAGAHVVQTSSLKAFSLQPTLSYKMLDDKLSVGVGMMVVWGNFSTSKALIGANALNAFAPMFPILGTIADKVPVATTLEGKTQIGVGLNIGLHYQLSPRWTVGLSYRSKVNMKVDKGEASLDFASPEIKQLIAGLSGYGVVIPPLDQGNFKAEMPIPANVNLGVAYRSYSGLLLSAELQWVGWGAFDELVIQFDEKVGHFKTVSPKGYSNTMIYRIGGQYTLCPKFDVRLGFYYDSTPVNKTQYYSPETPGSNKTAFTGGFTYRPCGGFAIDAALTYSTGPKTQGTFEYPTGSTPFIGEYKVSAFLPSLALRYSF